jgi:glutamate/tyrosine decarboxylase-like PLP-dependent enzyme
MTAPYLRGTLPTEYTGLDYLEFGPQMSRGFRALKVWMSLKHYGAEGYRKLLSQSIRCAEHLDRLVRASKDFEALHEPNLFIYSFRFAPMQHRLAVDGSSADNEKIDAYLDRINQRLADRMQASGTAFIMTSRLRGRVVLRFSICSHRTTLGDIEEVFAKLQELSRELVKEEEPAF